MNSNSSGDSGWIFASVMIGVTNGERKRKREEESQCQRARLKADTVLFKRDKKREREREREEEDQMRCFSEALNSRGGESRRRSREAKKVQPELRCSQIDN